MPTYRLTKLIEIKSRSESVNDFTNASPDGDPITIIAPWAEIESLSATERVNVNQVFPTADYYAVIRWTSIPISPTYWVEVNGRRFDILGTREIDGQYLYLYLKTINVAIGGATLR